MGAAVGIDVDGSSCSSTSTMIVSPKPSVWGTVIDLDLANDSGLAVDIEAGGEVLEVCAAESSADWCTCVLASATGAGEERAGMEGDSWGTSVGVDGAGFGCTWAKNILDGTAEDVLAAC